VGLPLGPDRVRRVRLARLARRSRPTSRRARGGRACGGKTAGGLRFHTLWHSYATWLVSDGVPPNIVQQIMGHEDVTTTLAIYTDVLEDYVDRVDGVFGREANMTVLEDNFRRHVMEQVPRRCRACWTAEGEKTLDPSDTVRAASLAEAFAAVPDPRSPKGRWHPLPVILLVAACAVTCDANGFTVVWQWAGDARHRRRPTRSLDDRKLHPPRPGHHLRRRSSQIRTGNSPDHGHTPQPRHRHLPRRRPHNIAHARRHHTHAYDRVLTLYGL
jgi:DDE_Tnp_1-associated/Phage integrase family